MSFARAGETHHKLCLENFVVPRSEITNKRVYADMREEEKGVEPPPIQSSCAMSTGAISEHIPMVLYTSIEEHTSRSTIPILGTVLCYILLRSSFHCTYNTA